MSDQNEAELLNNLEKRLREVLPFLPKEITLERNLHLKLGHRDLLLDGLQKIESTKGRYDLLISNEGRPLLIAELKAPDIALGEDDIKQGLSYARAHLPPVPLLLVTNGNDSKLVRAYDGVDISETCTSFDSLKVCIGKAAELAASDTKEAVDFLLGTVEKTWISLFRDWNAETFSSLAGGLKDLHLPLVHNFSLPRTVVDDVIESLKDGNPIQILHGPPLSGITNVLTQITNKFQYQPILYISNAEEVDVLLMISNRLSKDLGYPINKDQLRGWISGIGSKSPIVLVIDGKPKSDILDELVKFAELKHVFLVLGLDTEIQKKIIFRSSRNEKTAIGRLAHTYELKKMNDEEFEESSKVFLESCNALFMAGSNISAELRLPRNLRVIASLIPMVINEDGQEFKKVVSIPPMAGTDLLTEFGRIFASSPASDYDFKILAKTFLEDAKASIDQIDWLVSTFGIPSIEPSLAEERLGSDRIKRLELGGSISWIKTSIGPRVLIRLEEMLAFYISKEWSFELAKSTSDKIENVLNELIKLASRVPLGVVSLAKAIELSAQKNPENFSFCVNYLFRQEPKEEELGEGTRLTLLIKERPVNIIFGEGMNEKTVGNLAPWLVLSHLAFKAMPIEGMNYTFNLPLFEKLCSAPYLIYNPAPSGLEDMPSFHVHDIPGIGELPCLSSGIIEPVMQSLYFHAISHPDEFIVLAEKAQDDKNFFLAWRVLTIAYILQGAMDKNISEMAKTVQEILVDFIDKLIDAAQRDHGE